MSISLYTNVNALVAQRNLEVNTRFQSQTMERLSSGFRISSAGDDPAGLSIANNFRNETAQLTQGVRNANDAISQLQIMDGGLANISQILDRLKTLATQSSSGTFTGDRTTLDSEFQTLLAEVNRQAQSIGLNQSGNFTRSLAVFIGGGSGGAAGSATEVGVDLSASAVDSASLGLGGTAGMQVVSPADIGPGSLNHTVAQILGNAANTTAVSGYTDFYFSAPGFSGANKIKVSANLQGVTTLNGLVAALNAGISLAANGNNSGATAFQTAAIAASAANGMNLEFSSASTPFQVEAGDTVANAFLGNFVLNNGVAGTAGVPIASTVTGANTAAAAAVFTPAGVTVRVTGASLAAPVELALKPSSTTTALAIADLTSQVAGNEALRSAGISVSGSAGAPLVFTDSLGEAFAVQATGDTANALGLGSFAAGPGNAVDYASIQGAAYDNTTAAGTAHLEFSLNGAPSITVPPLDLSQGDATAATSAAGAGGALTVNPGDTLTFTVDGAAQTMTFAAGATSAADAMAQLNAAALGVTASLDPTGALVLASNSKGASSTLAITGGTAQVALGLASASYAGLSRSGASLASALNNAFLADPTLQAAGLTATVAAGALSISSANGTFFRVNAAGSTAAANLGFGVTGVPFSATLTVAAASNSAIESTGDTATAPLAFTPMVYGGETQTLAISTPDPATGATQTATVTLQNNSNGRGGSDLDLAITAINAQLQRSGNPVLQKIMAVKQDIGGAEKLSFLSSLQSFSVAVSASPQAGGVNSGAALTQSSFAIGSTQLLKIDTQTGAGQVITALATAINRLGAAQAIVGKAENQLSYALNLAQSQVTNFSSAESQIRDSDVAAEAANLSKAQILQQSSIAVMAQANSAPQAVLALLRG